MSRESMTGYRIRTYPYQDATGSWVKLLAHERVGYNDKDGTMVILKNCRGNYPILCEKQLTFQDGLKCERALALGALEGIEECRIRLEQPEETRVDTIAINKYILVTTDEKYEFRCQGQPTEFRELNPGTHLVEFTSRNCQVQGRSGWVLEGVEVHQLNVAIEPHVIDTSNVTVPQMPHQDYIEPVTFAELSSINGIKLKHVQPMAPFKRWTQMTRENINTYGIVILAVIILVTGLACGCKRIRKRVLCKKVASLLPKRCVLKRLPCWKEDSNGNDDIEMTTVPEVAYLGHKINPDAPPETVEELQRRYIGPTNPLLPPRYAAGNTAVVTVEPRPEAEIYAEPTVVASSGNNVTPAAKTI